VAGLEVDFAWLAQGVVLEVDGLEYHGGDVAFHRDRARDRVLAVAGFQVLRLTWRQLSDEPEACISALAIALTRRVGAAGVAGVADVADVADVAGVRPAAKLPRSSRRFAG
jgi:very-short-patch-repair endonuclease